ncbi:uncharacterized protein LOC110975865 [Acanthaster planci]|uniref:Uncharacterized protein LOC110975865 n=1 Tax=Acanthaster planci TaxID=133434 RepID=A0A8B7XU79_ACAPL|nr:uncharacterized protein LOC110975865 [Acanthaster planci]
MALHNYCRLGGLPDACSRVACDMEDFPELPKLADIFKNCDVPGLEETCYVLFVLLIIPVSAGVFFAVRFYIRPSLKGYEEIKPGNEATSQELAPLNTSRTEPVTEASAMIETETKGSLSKAASEGREGGATAMDSGETMVGAGSKTGDVSPAVEAKLHPA